MVGLLLGLELPCFLLWRAGGEGKTIHKCILRNVSGSNFSEVRSKKKIEKKAWSCAPLPRSKYSAPACLPVDTELIVTPMIHSSTFEVHESYPIVHGVCEGYDTVEAAVVAVSEG